MDDQVREKDQKRNTVSITIPNVPVSVHNKVKQFRRKIMIERNRDFSMMAAYCEFLKEHTKNLSI